MNIDGLGEAIIGELIERKLISNIADIYKLTIEDFEKTIRIVTLNNL